MHRFLLLSFFCTNLVAQTTLSGNVGGLTLESAGNPYLIADNIVVTAGKTFKINSGVTILFKPFTGLIIEEGNLEVNGTLEHPVVFTTENDKKYNPEAKQLPNPFDWNGILIKPSAGNVKLSNFILEYSVYGIKSQKESFSINNGTFAQNGQFHLTVKETVKPVADNIPFNFGIKTSDKNVSTNVNSWLKIPSYSLLGCGGLMAITGGYFFYTKSRYSHAYETEKSQTERDRLVSKQESSLHLAILFSVVGGSFLGLGTIGSMISLQSNTNKVTLQYLPGQTSTLTLSLLY